MIVERRLYKSEVRLVGENKNIIEGYGAMFDSPSVDMGFTEIIHKGFFDKADMSDVRMLNDHLSHMILARTKSGTLKVSVDEKGLFYSGVVSDTSYGKDLLVSVGRGDVDQSSFGFCVAKGGDTWEYENDTLYRHLWMAECVVDVSPTAFPAYEDTRIQARNQFSETKLAEIRNALSKKNMDYLDTMVLVHKILYS